MRDPGDECDACEKADARARRVVSDGPRLEGVISRNWHRIREFGCGHRIAYITETPPFCFLCISV